MYPDRILNQIENNTRKNKRWVRIDRIVIYSLSIITVALSILVLLQHNQIDALKSIASRDTVIANKSDSELKELQTTTNELNTLVGIAEANLPSTKNAFAAQNASQHLSKSPLPKKIKSININSSYDSLLKIINDVDLKTYPNNLYRDSSLAIADLITSAREFESANSNLALQTDKDFYSAWLQCGKLIESTIFYIKTNYTSSKDPNLSQLERWHIFLNGSPEVTSLNDWLKEIFGPMQYRIRQSMSTSENNKKDTDSVKTSQTTSTIQSSDTSIFLNKIEITLYNVQDFNNRGLIFYLTDKYNGDYWFKKSWLPYLYVKGHNLNRVVYSERLHLRKDILKKTLPQFSMPEISGIDHSDYTIDCSLKYYYSNSTTEVKNRTKVIVVPGVYGSGYF